MDDYSSDSTVEVVEQLAKSDSRIKLIRKEKNEGAYAARNTGLKYVTGDFITVHDSDDWSHPQKLEIQLRSILVNENIVGSLSNLIRTDYNVTPINRGSQLSDQYIMYNTSSLLLKKEVFEKLGEWDSVRVGADTEFHWRILKYFGDNSIINVGKTIPLSLCLSVTNSLTKTSETSVKTAKFGLRRIYREAASWWHNSQDFKRDPKITSESNRKFPSPMQNLSKNPKHEYDVILIDDFTSYSDQQLSIKLIKKFSDEGRKIAIFHYPYYRKNALEPIHDKVFDLIFKQNINIIVPTEKVNTEKLILCSSHLYDYILDQVPSINISREPIIIVDNINSEKNEKRSATIKKLFNSAPIWVNKHEIDKL